MNPNPSSLGKRALLFALSIVGAALQFFITLIALGVPLEKALATNIMVASRISLPLALTVAITVWLFRPRYCWGNRLVLWSAVVTSIIVHLDVALVLKSGVGGHPLFAFYELLLFGILGLIFKLERNRRNTGLETIP